MSAAKIPVMALPLKDRSVPAPFGLLTKQAIVVKQQRLSLAPRLLLLSVPPTPPVSPPRILTLYFVLYHVATTCPRHCYIPNLQLEE